MLEIVGEKENEEQITLKQCGKNCHKNDKIYDHIL
jgi:hypothetical protein